MMVALFCDPAEGGGRVTPRPVVAHAACIRGIKGLGRYIFISSLAPLTFGLIKGARLELFRLLASVARATRTTQVRQGCVLL